MIKNYLLVVFLFTSYFTQAQWIVKPILSAEVKSSSNSRIIEQEGAPLALPFWDDFSKSSEVPDTSLWESGRDVFINNQLATKAPTLNVATFDGTRASGQAHKISSSFNGAADSLISRPIDLSSVTDFNKNTVYLSFFWQARGAGEIPDDDDSIRLQLLTKIDTQLVWESRWQQRGGIENVHENFRYVEIPVHEDKYFHEEFRIKFQSFSNLQGQFDTWHIDYIYLNENRTSNDSIFVDRSISGNPGPLFGPYFQVPSKTFLRNPQNLNPQRIFVSNLDDQVQPTDVTYIIKNETSNETYLSYQITDAGFVSPGEVREIQGPDSAELSTINVPPFEGDSMVLSASFIYNSGDTLLYETSPENDRIYSSVNLRVNDTIKKLYTLHNQYAYDDGIAEFAVGINSNRGMVAVEYDLAPQDTFAVSHIDIYFPNIAPDATGKNVDIILWDRLEQSGIKARQPYTIQVPQNLNEFIRIKLESPVLVRDKFYIGYQQFIDNYIGVGFDKSNNIASDKIYTNVEGTWEQNTLLSGTLMIRPVFDINPVYVLNTDIEEKEELLPYPNPSQGMIRFKKPVEQLSIYDLSGHELLHLKSGNIFDVRSLQDGLYLLKYYINNKTFTQKLILQK